jgi:hypothetical protein
MVTDLACLQELLKRLQDRHGKCAQAVAKKAAADAASAATVSPDTPSVLQAMMQLGQDKTMKIDQVVVLYDELVSQ